MTVETADVAEIVNPTCTYTPRELALRIGGKEPTVLGWTNEKVDPLPAMKRRGSKIILIKGDKFIDWYDRNSEKVAQSAAPTR